MMQAERLFGQTPLRNRLGCSWSAAPETLQDLTGVERDVDALGDRQAHSSPFSGDSFALTPSQSYLTGFSDRSTGHFGGAEEVLTAHDTGSSYHLARRRGVSATIWTPSTPGISEGGSIPDTLSGDAPEVESGTGDQLRLLCGIPNQSSLTPYSWETQCAEVQATGIDTSTSAYVTRDVGQRPILSTYTSNQSHQEAIPWSKFASQPSVEQILPDSITDNDLSFEFQQISSTTTELTSPQKPDHAIIKARNQLSSDLPQRARHQRQKQKSRDPPRDCAEKNLRVRRGPLNPAEHLGVHLATSATSRNSSARRGGRQEGYTLPEADRISALCVRERGSCFRCLRMREKCSGGQAPCENCRRVIQKGGFRMWMTPCTFKKLNEQCEYLVPASLASQLAVTEMRALLTQHTGQSSRTFPLHLSIGFGEDWILKAVEIYPGNPELQPDLRKMFGFHPQVEVGTDRKALLLLSNPPVIPLWITPLQMQISIDVWLEKTIQNPQPNWQRHWFPDPSQAWQLQTLYAICQHYQHCKPTDGEVATTAHETLEWALKMAVLNYVMGHAFLVPEDKIDLLFGELKTFQSRGRRPEGKVCPRAANKFVKMMAVPVMRVVVEKTLSGLHELFRADVPHTELWDRMFAIVVLCLMVISSTQRSLMQRAVVCLEKNDFSFSTETAESDARRIDEELVVPIIGMFHDRFRTLSKNKGFNPLGATCNSGPQHCSPFATCVKTVTERYYRLDSSKKLSNMGAERLLAEFMQPFQPKRERGGSFAANRRRQSLFGPGKDRDGLTPTSQKYF